MSHKHPSGEPFEGRIGRTVYESEPWWPARATGSGKPNVMLIVLDDTGFSHFGCYGSAIDTPNIDRLAMYDFVEEFDEPIPDAEEVKLAGYFAQARSCSYVYDFGDDWRHAVKLRERVSSPGRFHRRLLAGRRACPPEDCGGVSGHVLSAKLGSRKHQLILDAAH